MDNARSKSRSSPKRCGQQQLTVEPTRRPADSESGPGSYTAGEEDAGQRLDNLLLRIGKNIPRTRIYKGVRKGEFRVNRGRAKQDYRVRVGDVLRLPPWFNAAQVAARSPESDSRESGGEGSQRRSRLQTLLESAVLFEDSALMAINKPAGLAVHGGSGISAGVIETVRQMRPRLDRVELVHRLDRDTSGCLLIAKRRASLVHMHALIRRNQMRKYYLLLVASGFGRRYPKRANAAQNVRCTLALRKRTTPSGERLVSLDSDGQASETRFDVVAENDNASLLLARPITGRTHQIRVHARALGFPIAGDPKYGDQTFSAHCREHGLKQMFLHAYAVEFPAFQEPGRTAIRAPLGARLEALLRKFELLDEERLEHLVRSSR